MAVPAIANNVPSAGHISWEAFHIQYQGVGYSVPAGETANKWVWWRFNAGVPAIQSGSSVPEDLTADDLVLFANKSGIAVRIQNSSYIDGELIVNGSILADAIAANQITSEHITVDGLDAGVIKFGEMSGDRIEAHTITALQIAADTITANEIAADTITANEIAADAITTNELAANSVEAENIKAAAVTANKVAAKAIDVSKLNVADLTNYVADGDLTDPTSANWEMNKNFPGMQTRVDPVGDFAYLEGLTATTRGTFFRNEHIFEIHPGDEFLLEFEIATPAANTVGIDLNPGMFVYDVDGAGLLWRSAATITVAPNTGWTPISVSIKIDPTDIGVASGQFNPWVPAASTGGQKLQMRKMMLRKKAAGKLIVDGTIEARNIGAEQIRAEHILVEAVTVDKIEANIVWTSEQYVGLIHIHPTEGITIPQLGTDDVTHFAADGSGNAISGAITANDGLVSYGGVNMQGTDNFLAGELKAGSGVNDPSQPPTVSTSYTTVSTGEPGATGGFLRKGLADYHDAVGNAWVTTDTANGDSNVQAWSKNGGTAYWGFDVLDGWSALGGVTQLAGYYYVLCRQNSNTANWRILVYRGSDKAYMGSFYTNPAGSSSIPPTAYPAIGHDGTHLMIAWPQSNVLYVRFINAWGAASPGMQYGNTYNCGTWGSSTHVQGIQAVAGVWYAAYNNAIYALTATSTNTAARNTAYEFPKNIGALAGIWHNGITWITFTSGKTFTIHSTLSGRWLWCYDFRDADPGGSGTANTRPSPVRDIEPAKFSDWTVTIPQSAPDDLTSDGANTCRIFAGPYGSAMVLQNQLVTDGDGITGKPLSYSKTFAALATSGTVPNTVNDFASRAGSIGRFSSNKQDGSEPMWHFDGDGSGKLAKVVRWNAAGTPTWLQDTGWIQPGLSSGFSYTTIPPQFRMLNGVVYLRGFLTRTAGYVANTTYTAFMNIPAGYRPELMDAFTAGNTASNGARIRLNSTGNLDVIIGATVPSFVSLAGVAPWIPSY